MPTNWPGIPDIPAKCDCKFRPLINTHWLPIYYSVETDRERGREARIKCVINSLKRRRGTLNPLDTNGGGGSGWEARIPGDRCGRETCGISVNQLSLD